MVTALVVCCGLLTTLPAESADPAPDLAAYEAAYEDARAKVGRDADAHVRLALWCEAHGLPAGRLKHLAIAALIEPGHATARGLMGLVAHAGGWKRPEAVADKLKVDDATLAEYKARRDRALVKVEDHWKLAQWCEENGLEAEAKAHLMIVTRIDPNHAAARKRLGYKKQGGRWVTDAQLAEEKAEAEAQKKADRAWKPRLEKYRAMLAGKDEAKRAEAKRALLEVADPRAVPAVWAVFGTGSAARQDLAVQLLGQIDGPAASRALTTLAVFSPAAGVRQAAMQTLARRDPRDFVGLLVRRLLDPIKYEVRPVEGPGSQGILFVEGKEFNVRRTYGTPAVHPQAGLPRIFAPSVPFDPFGEQNSYLMSQGLWGLDMSGLTPQTIKDIAAAPQNTAALLTRQRQERDATLLAREREAAVLRARQEWARAPGFENWDEVYRRSVELYPALVQRYQEDLRYHAEDVKKYQDEYLRYLMMVATQRDLELGLIRGDIERATLDAQQRLENDVRVIVQMNEAIHRWNSRLLPVLEAVTDQDLGEDRDAWFEWWTDEEGLALRPKGDVYKPTVHEVVEVPFRRVPAGLEPPPAPSAPAAPVAPAFPSRSHSCFGAGTPVRTASGPRAIESIRPGDQVLVQDVRTGELSFQPVLAVFHNPPNRTLRVSLGDESIVATGIHRFWKAGHGWVMARELKVGDPIRTLGGVAQVTAVAEAEDQPVFNLEVARGHDFFVGRQGALVHDNSVVRSTPEPFDAAPELAAVAPSASPR